MRFAMRPFGWDFHVTSAVNFSVMTGRFHVFKEGKLSPKAQSLLKLLRLIRAIASRGSVEEASSRMLMMNSTMNLLCNAAIEIS
jgi:hypothetical protein